MILYKSYDTRKQQFYNNAYWSATYGTCCWQGSRTPAYAVCTWFQILNNGWSKYIEIAIPLFNTFEKLKWSLEGIPNIKIIGEPKLCALAFYVKDNEKETRRLHQFLEKDKFKLNLLNKPIAINIRITQANVHRILEIIDKIEEFFQLSEAKKAELSSEFYRFYGTNQIIEKSNAQTMMIEILEEKYRKINE